MSSRLGVTRLMCAAALVALLVAAAFAQTTPPPDLKIAVLTEKVNDTSDQVTIHFLNQSTHNLSFPRPTISCAGLPREVVIEVFIVDASPPKYADSCDEARDWPPPSVAEILEQAKSWLLLHPRESVDVGAEALGAGGRLYRSEEAYSRHTSSALKIEEPGLYKVSAVYHADFLTSEQRQALQHAGYFVPSGDYESDRVDLRISAALVEFLKGSKP
jgi:hypothetical protein